MSNLSLLVVGESFRMTTTAAINSVTEFEEVKIKGILDYTAAMEYVNVTSKLDEWKNNSNINKLKDIDLKKRIYYLIDSPSSIAVVVIPDFLIVEDSIERISPSDIKIKITLNAPSDLDGLKEYLRVANLQYTIE